MSTHLTWRSCARVFTYGKNDCSAYPEKIFVPGLIMLTTAAPPFAVWYYPLGILLARISSWEDEVFQRAIRMVGTLGSHVWKTRLNHRPLFDRISRALQKVRSHSSSMDNCCDVLHNSFGWEKLNKLTLFLLIGSYSDFVRFKRRSVMNWLHCSLPTASIWRRIVTAAGPAVSLVSRTMRSSLSSRKELPKSSIVVKRDFTSLENDTWKLLCTSWWSAPWTSTSVVIEASNSLTSLDIIFPALISSIDGEH